MMAWNLPIVQQAVGQLKDWNCLPMGLNYFCSRTATREDGV
jgi:hypothetical protein